VKVCCTSLPPLHRLIQPEQDLKVPGGERRQVAPQAVPIARQMRMLRSDARRIARPPSLAGAD